MNRVDKNSDTTILRLALATLVAFLLASVGVLIAANSQIPVVANHYNWLQIKTQSQNQSQTQLKAQSQTNTLAQPLVIATRHHLEPVPESVPESIIASAASAITPTLRKPILRVEPSRSPEPLRPTETGHHPKQAFNQVFTSVASATAPIPRAELALGSEQSLRSELLKYNVFSGMRRMPDYFPSDTEYKEAKDAIANLNKRMETQQLEINVKTFLLSQRMSNKSRLAELQMQPFFAEFDRSAFSALNENEKQKHQPLSSDYIGVGFPHIENNDRSSANRYKPYRQLMSFSDDASGDVVPYVKCMGLSPERVAERASQYDELIAELSVKYNVSASLIKAVIAKESCFNPNARSHVGAIGLMQLMPATARWLKVKQPENPQQNLAGGVRYLAQLRKRFGGDELALAAYNAGPANVERYHGIPPFDETENYVDDVMHFYRGYAATTSYVNAQKSYYYP